MVKSPSCVYTFSSGDHAMSQAVILWPLTVQSWVKSHATLCGIRGGQSGTSVDFSLSASVFLIGIVPPMLSTILFVFHLPCIISSWQHSWITHKRTPWCLHDLRHRWCWVVCLLGVWVHILFCVRMLMESHGLTGCDAMLRCILCYLSHYVA